ncbi:hypothetical protein [Streptomyces sp. NPDC001978]
MVETVAVRLLGPGTGMIRAMTEHGTAVVEELVADVLLADLVEAIR